VKPLRRPGSLPARTRQLTSQACRRDNSTVHGHSSGRHRRVAATGTGKFATKVGLCLCAGQLIAGPVLASAAEAAPASEVTPVAQAAKVTPKITETTSTRTLPWGSRVRITAKVINPHTGKVVTSGPVRIQVWRKTKWINGGRLKLGRTGAVTFYSSPKGTTSYRTVFDGSGNLRSAISNKIQVRVVNRGARVLAEARRHTGALYKFGAAGPRRFDCSGFTMYVYRKTLGKKLPHKANSQQRYGRAVSKGRKQVGDLIVFRSGSYGYHAAVYAGGGYVYDSPHTGARVGRHKIFSGNYVVRRMA
jgi:cell wall-associated NlpC family hydrolase